MSGKLFAHTAGAGGVPAVLLHGFGSTHAVWRPVQDNLSRDRLTLAYDLPGHGRSLDMEQKFAPKLVVSQLLTDLSERGIERFHLCGHSMGGASAALMALEAPHRVASLTLLAPGGFGAEINGRVLRRYAEAHDTADVRHELEDMFGWANPVPDEAVAQIVEMRKTPGQVEKLVEIVERISRDGRQGVIAREALASLEMPVKVVWGTQDRILPTRQAHRLPGHFAAHIFEDTGHMLAQEIPGQVIRLIRENIREF